MSEPADQRYDRLQADLQQFLDRHKLKLRESVLGPPGLFYRTTTFVLSILPTSAAINMKDAQQGALDGWSVLNKLYRAETDLPKKWEYLDDLDALLLEEKSITEKILQGNEGNYDAITAEIKAAAKSLVEAKARADKLASNLELGADLLSGFGKFASALPK